MTNIQDVSHELDACVTIYSKVGRSPDAKSTPPPKICLIMCVSVDLLRYFLFMCPTTISLTSFPTYPFPLCYYFQV